MEATMTMLPEALPIVKSSLALKRKSLEFNLSHYRTRLNAFETQYQMSSEQFAERYRTGELGDDPEWFDWEFVLDAYQETSRQLELLGSVRI